MMLVKIFNNYSMRIVYHSVKTVLLPNRMSGKVYACLGAGRAELSSRRNQSSVFGSVPPSPSMPGMIPDEINAFTFSIP